MTVLELTGLVGGVVALATLIKGLAEYIRQGKQKRAEQFLEMRHRHRKDEIFRQICKMLDTPGSMLATLPIDDKIHFLGLYEEVALMVNSGLIYEDVAHYMFGYYAIRCQNRKDFWVGLEDEEAYWKLFQKFAARMSHIEGRSEFTRRRLRF